MDNIVTILPASRLRLIDCARAALLAGCRLWSNGRALAAAPHRPAAGWHRVGVRIVMQGDA
jgi:hypothetical protein